MGGKRKSTDDPKQRSIASFFAKRPRNEASHDTNDDPKPVVASSFVQTAHAETRAFPVATSPLSDTETSGVATVKSEEEEEEKDEYEHEVSTKGAAVQPFKERCTWVCPYKASKQCSHSPGYFPTLRGVSQHVRLAHPDIGLVTPYEVDPTADGTRKIPCHKGCGEMFVTHQKAVQHAKLPECTATPGKSFPCPWKTHIGCDKEFDSSTGLANHSRRHAKDTRSPYQCKNDECGIFHADLYDLAMHEERCKKGPLSNRETSYRFSLTADAANGAPPSVIIINRSSKAPPQCWKDGTTSIKEGLPQLGRKYLAHYASWRSSYSGGSAVLHSCYEAVTRYIPAPAFDNSFLGETPRQKVLLHRAFRFTQAIVHDIEAANQAGIKPTIISVGADGWFCSQKAILPWLQATRLSFDFVVRLSCLPLGISAQHADLHYKVWWILYDVKHIRIALESGPGQDQNEKADELIAAWKMLQDSKDTSFGRKYGRNYVDPDLKFPLIE